MSSVYYRIPKEAIDCLDIKRHFYDYKESNVETKNGIIELCIHDLDEPESNLEDIFELFEIPYDSWWTDMYGLYINQDGERSVRFEKDEKGVPVRKVVGCSSRNNDYREKNKTEIEFIDILNTLDNKGEDDAREILHKAIKQNQVDCSIEDANIPSRSRMMFIAFEERYHKYTDSIYDKTVDFNYIDKKSNTSLLEMIKKNINKINKPLQAKIKKGLLKRNQLLKHTEEYNSSEISL